jgi:hypothetical protein
MIGKCIARTLIIVMKKITNKNKCLGNAQQVHW